MAAVASESDARSSQLQSPIASRPAESDPMSTRYERPIFQRGTGQTVRGDVSTCKVGGTEPGPRDHRLTTRKVVTKSALDGAGWPPGDERRCDESARPTAMTSPTNHSAGRTAPTVGVRGARHAAARCGAGRIPRQVQVVGHPTSRRPKRRQDLRQHHTRWQCPARARRRRCEAVA